MPRSTKRRLPRRSDPFPAHDDGWEWDDFAMGDFETGEDDDV